MMPENTDDIDTSTIPRLVSAARREFLIRQGRTPENVKWMEEDGTPVSKDEWSGPQMQAMTDLFRIIGSELHGTGFAWSEYNKGAWIEYELEPSVAKLENRFKDILTKTKYSPYGL
jgi:hypothetical protein